MNGSPEHQTPEHVHYLQAKLKVEPGPFEGLQIWANIDDTQTSSNKQDRVGETECSVVEGNRAMNHRICKSNKDSNLYHSSRLDSEAVIIIVEGSEV